jgi:hypothetical protein
MESAVEMVEEQQAGGLRLSEVLEAYGRPLREHPAREGRTLVYGGVAFDVAEGHVVRRVFFR